MKAKWIALALILCLTACGISDRENPAISETSETIETPEISEASESTEIPDTSGTLETPEIRYQFKEKSNAGGVYAREESAELENNNNYNNDQDRILKIGVFEPRSGDNGAGGKQEILGIQYAHYIQPSLDIDGETYDVHLEIADNKTTPENAPEAAEYLINRGVAVILGSYGSGASIAGGEIFSQAGIPAIGASCTNPKVTADCDVYFRICYQDAFQGAALADYAGTLGVYTAYTLAMDGNQYDQGVVDYFTREFEARGGRVISDQFPEGCADFDSYIRRAIEEEAGVILAPVSVNYARFIIKSALFYNFQGVLLGADTWDNHLILQDVRGRDIRVDVSTFYRESGSDFDKGIREWLNANPDMLYDNGGSDMISSVTAMGYDAYFTALAAAEKANGAEPEQILDALPSVVYPGVSGLIAFDYKGDALRDEIYIKSANTQSGEWEFITTQRLR